MVAIGYSGGDSLEDIGIYTDSIKHLRYVVILLFVVSFAGYVVIRYFKKRRGANKGLAIETDVRLRKYRKRASIRLKLLS